MALPLRRNQAFLPTVKCSNCGADIDIEHTADHHCALPPVPSHQPFKRFADAFSSMSVSQTAPAPFRTRPIPPRIDASVANQPFLRGPPTPSSIQSMSRSASPATVASGRKSPYRMPPRSATAPLPPRSPSPDLPLAQECAFPIFPTTTSRSTTPSTPKRPPERSHTASPGGMGGSLSRPAAPLGNEIPPNGNVVVNLERKAAEGARLPIFAPQPDSQLPEGARQRRPSISSLDFRRKQSFSAPRPLPEISMLVPTIPILPPQNETTGTDLPSVLVAGRPSHETVQSRIAPSTSSDKIDYQRPPIHMRQPSVTAANRPLDEIGSVRLHRPTLSRSGSPPKLDTGLTPPRSASATGHRYGRSFHDAPPVPGLPAMGHKDLDIPRSSSASGVREARPFDPPPIPTYPRIENQESPTNLNHTPTESTSSNGSRDSTGRTSSSQSSPPTSALSMSPESKQLDAWGEQARNVASANGQAPVNGSEPREFRRRAPAKSFSRPTYATPVVPLEPKEPRLPFQSELPQSAPEPRESTHHFQPEPSQPGTRSREPRLPFQPEPRQNPPEARGPRLPFQTVPHQNMPEPREPRLPFQSDTRQPQPAESRRPSDTRQPSQTDHLPPMTPESPMDPALKGGRLPPLITNEKLFAANTQQPPVYPRSATTPSYRGVLQFPNPVPAPLNISKTPLRRATTNHKGKCRGCGDMIVGKSVSSADGRLTGRWHKQCFACKTCKEPFPTMDFYVLGNDPYCNRHYHQLNHSLCSNCDRGIEGQYVETDDQKFHPHCFKCCECHLILRDNYFDLNGKIYCEKHAFKSDFLGVGLGRRFPEKRSTRLMMM